MKQSTVVPAAPNRSWLSLELLVVGGILLMSLCVGSTLALTAYTHGFTALPERATPR